MTEQDEQALIVRISADARKSSGSCTPETPKVVEALVAHAMAGGVSPEFDAAVDEYEHQLSANVECSASWRHVQRIRAVRNRLQGIFFLEDAWGKQLNAWIESLGELPPLVPALDDLYRLAPKSKPTKKWHKQVQQLFDAYSEEAVRSTVLHAMTLLADVGAAGGLNADNETKLRGMLMLLSVNAQESDSELLRKLAMIAYTKVPYEGPVSTSVGNLCLQLLSELPGTQGLVHLSELASQLKYPTNAVALAERRLEEAASAKGLTVNQLQSMNVPDYGLED